MDLLFRWGRSASPPWPVVPPAIPAPIDVASGIGWAGLALFCRGEWLALSYGLAVGLFVYAVRQGYELWQRFRSLQDSTWGPNDWPCRVLTESVGPLGQDVPVSREDLHDALSECEELYAFRLSQRWWCCWALCCLLPLIAVAMGWLQDEQRSGVQSSSVLRSSLPLSWCAATLLGAVIYLDFRLGQRLFRTWKARFSAQTASATDLLQQLFPGQEIPAAPSPASAANSAGAATGEALRRPTAAAIPDPGAVDQEPGRGQLSSLDGRERVHWIMTQAANPPAEMSGSFSIHAYRLVELVDGYRPAGAEGDADLETIALLEQLLQDLLDAWQRINPAELANSSTVPWLDEVLGALRTIAQELVQRPVVPDPWRFASPPSPGELKSEARTLLPEFCSHVPAGRVGVRSFRVGPGQDCQMFVSAGPVPVRYEELLHALAELADHRPYDSLKTWSAVDAKTLDYAAREFYEQFYEQLARESVTTRSDLTAWLLEMMKDSFHLLPFSVRLYRDVAPDWLEAEGKLRTGCVQVLRPGLVEADHPQVMCVRAKVVVE